MKKMFTRNELKNSAKNRIEIKWKGCVADKGYGIFQHKPTPVPFKAASIRHNQSTVNLLAAPKTPEGGWTVAGRFRV